VPGLLAHVNVTAKERKIIMQIYQHFREDLYNNIISLSHNIYHDTPTNRPFGLIPLAFVILTKVIFYILLTVFALAVIYYTFHIACLVDDVCFSQNYEVLR